MDVVFFNKELYQFLDAFKQPTWGHIYKTIELLRMYGYQLGLPQSRALGGKLFELRVRGVQEVRIIYTFYRSTAVILYAFVKKTQKTPHYELKIAEKRLLVLTKT